MRHDIPSAGWTTPPVPAELRHDTESVRQHWDRLHAGDALPCPTEAALLQGWAQFHSGSFELAAQAGLALGAAGTVLVNKATALYANYVEPHEAARQALLMQVATRATAHTLAEPRNASAWYWQAYALGRYSQGISVAKALAQGLGSRIKAALERAIALEPRHADAHIALGAFHAEVIDKVGTLIGGMTYGARHDVGLRLFEDGLRLNPGSVIGRIEYANGLVMLEGDDRIPQATRLYEQVASSQPADAQEHLEIALARAELRDDPEVEV